MMQGNEGAEIEFPIRLYEGNNNPDAAKIIDYAIKNWLPLAEDWAGTGVFDRVFFKNHPQVFPDITKVIHINDTYYITAVRIYADNRVLTGTDVSNTVFRIDNNAPDGTFVMIRLTEDGKLTISKD